MARKSITDKQRYMPQKGSICSISARFSNHSLDNTSEEYEMSDIINKSFDRASHLTMEDTFKKREDLIIIQYGVYPAYVIFFLALQQTLVSLISLELMALHIPECLGFTMKRRKQFFVELCLMQSISTLLQMVFGFNVNLIFGTSISMCTSMHTFYNMQFDENIGFADFNNRYTFFYCICAIIPLIFFHPKTAIIPNKIPPYAITLVIISTISQAALYFIKNYNDDVFCCILTGFLIITFSYGLKSYKILLPSLGKWVLVPVFQILPILLSACIAVPFNIFLANEASMNELHCEEVAVRGTNMSSNDTTPYIASLEIATETLGSVISSIIHCVTITIAYSISIMFTAPLGKSISNGMGILTACNLLLVLTGFNCFPFPSYESFAMVELTKVNNKMVNILSSALIACYGIMQSFVDISIMIPKSVQTGICLVLVVVLLAQAISFLNFDEKFTYENFTVYGIGFLIAGFFETIDCDLHSVNAHIIIQKVFTKNKIILPFIIGVVIHVYNSGWPSDEKYTLLEYIRMRTRFSAIH